MIKRVVTILGLIAILISVIPASAQVPELEVPEAVAAGISGAKGATDVYIIGLIDDPVVAYEGGVPGLEATKPPQGQKINPNSNKVKKYVAHLVSKHDAVLTAVGASDKKIYDYSYSFNGFAAALTKAQVEAVKSQPGVVHVWADEMRKAVTENSPKFLGLSAPGGLWSQGYNGEDVIIGVIDTGIWPEHPSFSDQTDLVDRSGKSGKRSLAYGPPPAGWYGTCQSGEQWSQDDCNNKLIGARYFLSGYGHYGVIKYDYKSPRDADGHGSHTASTAGGNAGVKASIFGIARGVISGMAPRARIAVYKALWNDGSGFTSDLTAAIDAAVADGVDVINYSIGSLSPTFLGSDDIAFLFAARYGVFVAVSAGNEGPGVSTVGSPGVDPWVTTVGASTQNRTFQGSAKLGSGAEFFGASITGSSVNLPLVDAANAGGELCVPGALNPAVVAGKIVLCKRGAVDRVDKSLAVYMAGGKGTILYNAAPNQSLNTDNHWTPAVHVTDAYGLAIKAYIASTTGPTAKINGGTWTAIPAPWMADFSSRGPNGGAADIIKPDITAPGVNILAANTPTAMSGAPGQMFQSIGGTSMSSPHIAGILALLKDAHPAWSPAMAKSAIMTTAYQSVKKEDGSTDADPFDMGAGHVNPNPAVEPGLVYDAGWRDYLAFLCGSSNMVSPSSCEFLASLGYSFDPSDFNLASMAVAELAGMQTVKRTVTNVSGAGATYNVLVSDPAGIDVAVTPASLTLAAGASETYEVTFTTLAGATLNAWTFGSLTWSDGTHSVRSPIAIKPVELSAPDELAGTGVSDSIDYDITFGYSGNFAALPHGLVAATTEAGNVVDDPADDINVALATGVGITIHMVTVPGDTEYARFSLFDAYTDGEDDLDLYVFDPDGNLVGSSGGGTSAEEVNLIAPAAGDYYIVVHGWGTDGPDANYTLFWWLLDETDQGNMTLTAPSSATLGATETITVDWSGLTAGTKYLGSVSYHNVASPIDYHDGLIDFTVVRVDTD